MSIALVISLIAMGLLGSWHCGVMCGPLVGQFSNGKKWFGYHIGRIISYSLLATLLFFGSQFLFTIESRPLKIFSSVLMVLVLFLAALNQFDFKIGKNKLNGFIQKAGLFRLHLRIFRQLNPYFKQYPILLGFMTGLLPCGWLYSFLILAAQLPRLYLSILVIVIFWLTTLPIFFFINSTLQYLVKNSKISHQKIAGVVLFIAGGLAIFGHWSEIMLLQ